MAPNFFIIIHDMEDVGKIECYGKAARRDFEAQPFSQFSLRGALKKRLNLGKFSQMCEPTHPPQGFCEIWENER